MNIICCHGNSTNTGTTRWLVFKVGRKRQMIWLDQEEKDGAVRGGGGLQTVQEGAFRPARAVEVHPRSTQTCFGRSERWDRLDEILSGISGSTVGVCGSCPWMVLRVLRGSFLEQTPPSWWIRNPNTSTRIVGVSGRRRGPPSCFIVWKKTWGLNWKISWSDPSSERQM